MMRSLKSNRTFEINLGIEKGKNWFNKSNLTRFDPMAWFHLLKAPMVSSEYINKSVGVTKGLNPHKNSVRLGWKRDHDLNIKWYVYSYIAGEHSENELSVFGGQEELIISFKNIELNNKGIIESRLAMEVAVPNNPTLVQTIIIPFKPRWFTNFYWGGEPFPNKADYFWYRSNLSKNSNFANFINTAFSFSPLLVSFGLAMAIFLILFVLSELSIGLTITVSILGMISFLGFVLRNFINYEKWLYILDRFLSRIKSRRKEK